MSSTSTSTDRPRYRSSTMGSIQTLTRALRESLRLRRLRKQKRRNNEANNEQMRTRSKSVGNEYIDDEISEIGISVVVASDIGPIINTNKSAEKSVIQQRRQSKSVDEMDIKRQMDSERTRREKLSSKSLSINGQMRRRSKDDHDLPKTITHKDPHYYQSEQKGFRKRFGQIFGSLRSRHQTHTQLRSESPPNSTASSPSDCEDKGVKKDMIRDNHKDNDDNRN